MDVAVGIVDVALLARLSALGQVALRVWGTL
jgi:hypothetical protein